MPRGRNGPAVFLFGELAMKVKALRTVYNRIESKEYQKGEVFDTDERTARVFVKLRKAELVAEKAPPRKVAEPVETVEHEIPRRQYRRRDMQAEGE
jgi:hypothetical protein